MCVWWRESCEEQLQHQAAPLAARTTATLTELPADLCQPPAARVRGPVVIDRQQQRRRRELLPDCCRRLRCQLQRRVGAQGVQGHVVQHSQPRVQRGVGAQVEGGERVRGDGRDRGGQLWRVGAQRTTVSTNSQQWCVCACERGVCMSWLVAATAVAQLLRWATRGGAHAPLVCWWL